MARSSHPDERVKIPFRVTLAAIAMILVWFGLGGVGGQAMGGLSELQENSAASFLPEDAESTVVANALADFQDSTALPLIIVAARDGGLQPDDLGRAQALAKELPGTSTALSDGSTIADFLATPPQVPLTAVPSQDGQALLLVLPLNADKISEKVGEDIALKVVADDIREAVASQLGDAGMTAYVTGPAGFISDLSSAFGGIDGILLGVALVVVLVILSSSTGARSCRSRSCSPPSSVSRRPATSSTASPTPA